VNVGYDDFIYLFGVVKLEQSGTDIIKLDGKYRNVEVFEGIPVFKDPKILMPGYDNGPPRRAFAYSYPNQGTYNFRRTCFI
jgi:hypothetical protein